MEVVCQKLIHQGWEEWDRAIKTGHKLRKLFHKYQYIYSSEKGKISLVRTLSFFPFCSGSWEIYSWGKLFNDVEKFSTKKKAEVRIMEILK